MDGAWPPTPYVRKMSIPTKTSTNEPTITGKNDALEDSNKSPK